MTQSLALVAFTLLALAGVSTGSTTERGAGTPSAQSREARIRDFYDQARAIIKENQNLELSLEQARRRVHKLHKDIEAWSKTADIELTRRSRTYNHNSETDGEPASTELCPLFFAEELDELCPLDANRSEVWGARMVLCRYECLK